MKWLKKNECPWNANTFSTALKCGSIKVLEWLQKNECPLDANTSLTAVTHGNNEVLLWFLDTVVRDGGDRRKGFGSSRPDDRGGGDRIRST